MLVERCLKNRALNLNLENTAWQPYMSSVLMDHMEFSLTRAHLCEMLSKEHGYVIHHLPRFSDTQAFNLLHFTRGG